MDVSRIDGLFGFDMRSSFASDLRAELVSPRPRASANSASRMANRLRRRCRSTFAPGRPIQIRQRIRTDHRVSRDIAAVGLHTQGGRVPGTDAGGGNWMSYRSSTRPREVVLLSVDEGWQVAWGRHQIQDGERPEWVGLLTA